MPAPIRSFIGWNRPLLPAVVAHLSRGWSSGPLNLSRCLVVVSTRQAARRLREALAARAAESGAGVLPPILMTPEAFLRACVPPDRRLATPLQSLVAWTQTLLSINIHNFSALFPIVPKEPGWLWAARVAESLLEARQILGENGLTFTAAAANLVDGEAERWAQLADLERRYLALLSEDLLEDADAAKAAAAGEPSLALEIDRVVVASVCDPVPLAWEALKNVAAQSAFPVEILVHAPREVEANFDHWGRPDEAYWTGCDIALGDFADTVHICATPAAQAEKAALLLRECLAQNQLTALGVADADLVPWLEDRLRKTAGLATYDPQGRSYLTHPLAHVLRLLEELLRERSFAAFASLLRQPTILNALGGWHGWLSMADETAAKNLPVMLDDAVGFLSEHCREAEKGGDPPRSLRDAARSVLTLLDKLESGPFAPVLLEVLTEWHRGRTWDTQRPDDSTWIEVAQSITQSARDIDDALRARNLSVSTADRLGLLLRILGRQRVELERPEAALDLSGWLELPWVDEQELIVAGFNEGRVPDGISEHPFLPDHVRRRLGLRTNATRLARDSYLLTSLVMSRSGGAVRILLGKAGSDNEPLRPSRLLFRCPDAEMATRAMLLFRETDPTAAEVPSWERAWRYRLPTAPSHRLPMKQLRVTQFKDYLRCPFRFYLRHVLGMEPIPPAPMEMDALSFGTLLHETLASLGRDRELRECDDQKRIADGLEAAFNLEVQRRFGSRLPVPVHAQIEAALARLNAAAHVHAEEVRQGWRIIEAEYDFGKLSPFRIGGTTIVGRIDRIERHTKTGAVRVLDYKTSYKTKAPDAIHLTGPKSGRLCESWPEWRLLHSGGSQPRGWCDLQLPLYLLALRPLFGEQIQSGYFLLPAAASESQVVLFPLPEGALESAQRCVRAVVDAIAAGQFWPPSTLDNADEFESLFFGDVIASLDEATLSHFASVPS